MRLSREQSKSLASTVRKFHPLAHPDVRAGQGRAALVGLGFAAPGSECVEWGMGTSSGYGNISMGRKLHIRMHRGILETDRGAVLKDLALHRCGNKLCVNLAHLYEGTYSDNEADKRRLGETRLMGETHPNAKLTQTQVDEIRLRYIPGHITHRELAEEYGVNRRIIGGIVNGETWRS